MEGTSAEPPPSCPPPNPPLGLFSRDTIDTALRVPRMEGEIRSPPLVPLLPPPAHVLAELPRAALAASPPLLLPGRSCPSAPLLPPDPGPDPCPAPGLSSPFAPVVLKGDEEGRAGGGRGGLAGELPNPAAPPMGEPAAAAPAAPAPPLVPTLAPGPPPLPGVPVSPFVSARAAAMVLDSLLALLMRADRDAPVSDLRPPKDRDPPEPAAYMRPPGGTR